MLCRITGPSGSDCAVRAAHAPIFPPRSECSAGNINYRMPTRHAPAVRGNGAAMAQLRLPAQACWCYSEIEAQGRGSLHPHATSHHTKPTIQEPIISEMTVPGT